ncbi:unnamed protein product [Periconia digitata]|uniref:Major facilitator superfamily (MFS) profile domain-containing protein n=1 Tax=Periconia digitata TaxID=1303443 RepID=A0A9W4XR17_9PLEO|nr:unnamed protein product [Periconia digitata]
MLDTPPSPLTPLDDMQPHATSQQPRSQDPVLTADQHPHVIGGSLQKPGSPEHREDDDLEAGRANSSKHSSIHMHIEKHDKDSEANTIVMDLPPPYSVFTRRKKLFVVFLAALGGLFSPLSANIYFPALPALARDYNVSSTLMNLTLTSYMIFQGLAPAVFGDLADQAGRRPAYLIGFVIYIGANIGLALQDSYAALFVLRCIQSTGSSATIALGNGVVADVATSAERGTWMGYVTSGPMVAPALGPILGGVLAKFLGWRAIFWFLTIFAGAYLVAFAVGFPETGRNVVGNGSIPPKGWNMSLLDYLHHRNLSDAEASKRNVTSQRRLRFPNPLGTLRVLVQKDAGLLLFYNSLIYTAFYCVITSAPYLLEQIYGYNELQVGLAFIPFGIGAMAAPMINGKLMDFNFRRLARTGGFPIDKRIAVDLKDFPLELARLQVALPLLAIGTAAILCYGWTLEVETSIAAPLIMHFLMGLFLTGAFNCLSVMVVDYYPLSPATATAANNLARCLIGAAGSAIINIMVDAMGRGWCFTFIAGVLISFSPLLVVLLKWGPGWREGRRVRELETDNAGT